ncbi:MAG: TolC family protein [Magnetococcales bacterium]|nr:TolC family protein [Magnetococcales bacterium]
MVGCSAKPGPLLLQEQNQQINFDMAADPYHPLVPIHYITIDDAMAHAIKFNLDHRVKIMDQTISRGFDSISSYRLLADLASSAGYMEQDKTENRQLKPYFGSLVNSWNILDLGISYINARQQDDPVMKAAELQRKAAHKLLSDVRSAFWRGKAEERLSKAINLLKIELDKSPADYIQINSEQTPTPSDSLNHRTKLLETLQKLQLLQKQVAGARDKLAKLMGLESSGKFVLVEQKEGDPIKLQQLPAVEILENYALQHRPELVVKGNKRQIQAYETRKAAMRLFPGLDFAKAANIDTNEPYANNRWSELGVTVTWRVLNLLETPAATPFALNRVKTNSLNRAALNISVLVQLHVALRNLIESRGAYDLAEKLYSTKEQLYNLAKTEQQTETANEFELISRNSEKILYLSHRDLAFAKLQNAAGDFLISLGWEIIPKNIASLPFEILTKQIKNSNQQVTSCNIPGLTLTDKQIEKTSDKAALPVDTELDTPEWIIIEQVDGAVKPKKKLPPQIPTWNQASLETTAPQPIQKIF